MASDGIAVYLYRFRKKIAGALLLVFCGWFVYHYFTRSGLDSLRGMECKHEISKKMIEELCSLYKKGKVIGDKCQAICDNGNIHFKQCMNYNGGKHVLLVDCVGSCEAEQTTQAMLKMNHIRNKDMIDHYEKIDRELYQMFTYIKVFDGNAHAVDYWIDAKVLAHKTREMLKNEFGKNIDDDEDVIGLLWGEDHKNFQEVNDDNPAYPMNFVRTLWSLLIQNEYKMSVVFNKYKLFPKIYGFCGPVYLAEHAPFDQRLDRRIQNFEMISWRQRVASAIHILNLVKAADNLQTPLHFCDVKTPHFGVNSEGEIRFSDSDTVFTNDTLSTLFQEISCESNKECDFFDCKGVCNTEAEMCEGYRSNNNLQSVCSIILDDKKEHVFEGLLAKPPQAAMKNLQSLLKECAYGVTERREKVAFQRPSEKLMHKLTNLLLESLEY